jgi:N-acetylglutamate synthase-like GNAT family acetyltransferase
MQNIHKRSYDYKNRFGKDYDQVISFLIKMLELNPQNAYVHWGRFAWMISRPLDDENLKSSFTIWECANKIVGLSFFELDTKYQFLIVDDAFKVHLPEMLEVLNQNPHQLDEMYLLIPEEDLSFQKCASNVGYIKSESFETVLEKHTFQHIDLPNVFGLEFVDMTNDWDFMAYNRVMWKGFDHEGEPDQTEEDILWRKTMLSSPDLDKRLVVALRNRQNEYVAHTGIWYKEKTEVAYVEPLVTIPEYRQKGLGKIVLEHALYKANQLGAKKAIVLSDQMFYIKCGFKLSMKARWWKKTWKI